MSTPHPTRDTAWRPTVEAEADGEGEPYSFITVLECVRSFDMGYLDYKEYTHRAKLPRVMLVDRQKLLEEILGDSVSQVNVDACLSGI